MFTDLFTPLIGADWAALLAAIIWTGIVILVIVVAWKLYLAFAGGINLLGGRGRDIRLAIIDAAPVDQKRRIILVRRDGVEHLLMIGGPNDVVIEQGISAPVSLSKLKPEQATAQQTAAPQAATKKAKKLTQTANVAAPAAAIPTKTSEPLKPLEADAMADIDFDESDMFDSLIADHVASAETKQPPLDIATDNALDIPPAPQPTPKAQPQPSAPALKPAPSASKQAESISASQTASRDASLEDEMQALIRDLQTK